MTISSPDTIDTTLIQDGQAAGSITPSDMRVVVDSLAGIFAPTAKTVSYTAVLADRGTCIEMNAAGALNFTVPQNSAVSYDIGTVLVVTQLGAGQVTLVQDTNVTIRTPSSLLTRAQYSTVSVRKRATNEWVAGGDLQ